MMQLVITRTDVERGVYSEAKNGPKLESRGSVGPATGCDTNDTKLNNHGDSDAGVIAIEATTAAEGGTSVHGELVDGAGEHRSSDRTPPKEDVWIGGGGVGRSGGRSRRQSAEGGKCILPPLVAASGNWKAIEVSNMGALRKARRKHQKCERVSSKSSSNSSSKRGSRRRYSRNNSNNVRHEPPQPPDNRLPCSWLSDTPHPSAVRRGARSQADSASAKFSHHQNNNTSSSTNNSNNNSNSSSNNNNKNSSNNNRNSNNSRNIKSNKTPMTNDAAVSSSNSKTPATTTMTLATAAKTSKTASIIKSSSVSSSRTMAMTCGSFAGSPSRLRHHNHQAEHSVDVNPSINVVATSGRANRGRRPNLSYLIGVSCSSKHKYNDGDDDEGITERNNTDCTPTAGVITINANSNNNNNSNRNCSSSNNNNNNNNNNNKNDGTTVNQCNNLHSKNHIDRSNSSLNSNNSSNVGRSSSNNNNNNYNNSIDNSSNNNNNNHRNNTTHSNRLNIEKHLAIIDMNGTSATAKSSTTTTGTCDSERHIDNDDSSGGETGTLAEKSLGRRRLNDGCHSSHDNVNNAASATDDARVVSTSHRDGAPVRGVRGCAANSSQSREVRAHGANTRNGRRYDDDDDDHDHDQDQDQESGSKSDVVASRKDDGDEIESLSDNLPLSFTQKTESAVLPPIVRAGGNWKAMQISNISAALRAGRGCRAAPSDFVFKEPKDGEVDTSFNYSDEVLAQWRDC